MTRDTNKERAEFEAWYASQPDAPNEPERSYELDEAGMNELIKDCIWEGWKARAAKAPAAPTGWYALAADGMATLCVDRDDAEKTAAESEKEWPNCGPFRAVQLYTAPPAPTEQWVSVAERLPNPHQEVLLVIDGGHVTTGSYMPNLHCFCWEPCDDEREDGAVTHWMTKPAPPQGAAKGDGNG